MDPKLKKKGCIEAGVHSASKKKKAGIFECFAFLDVFFKQVNSEYGNQPKQTMNNNNEELEEEQVNVSVCVQ